MNEENKSEKLEFCGKIFDAELQGLPGVAMQICFGDKFSEELKNAAEQYLLELFAKVTPGRLQ